MPELGAIGMATTILMYTMVNALEDVPCLVRFSSAATHDHTFLKDLNLEEGSFVVFDKAYNDYLQYLQWTCKKRSK